MKDHMTLNNNSVYVQSMQANQSNVYKKKNIEEYYIIVNNWGSTVFLCASAILA